MANVYAIHEGNMERLMKKITRIQNKCRKFGCDFLFREVGEEYRDLKADDGTVYKARFVLVEAEGKAEVNGWKFIASVEHTEKGNIINKAVSDVEVPARYYDCAPICEHCNTNRWRKDTFIVMNEETGEFKMVGKSCLKDFTKGMSAEAVAQYTSAFEEIIEGEAPSEGWYRTRYYDVHEYLCYVAETIRHFGYTKADPDGGYVRTTRMRADDYYCYDRNWIYGPGAEDIKAEIRDEMEKVGFDHNSDRAKADVDAALAWLDAQTDNNNYMHNLKVACALDYDGGKNLGILASLFPTYNRNLEIEAERRKRAESEKISDWVGAVGDKVTVDVDNVACITSWETMYGTTYVWKITGKDGNIFTWKSSRYLCSDVKVLKGTVKEHKEFRGVKQTELTRCRCAA